MRMWRDGEAIITTDNEQQEFERYIQEGWWNSTWYDPRRAPGGQAKLQGRLRDGFAALAAGEDEDLNDEDPYDRLYWNKSERQRKSPGGADEF